MLTQVQAPAVSFSLGETVMSTISKVRGDLKEHPSFRELLDAGFSRNDAPSEPDEEFRVAASISYLWPPGWSQLVTSEIGYRDSYGGFWTRRS